ncbi:MAG: YebC/PmpR family DNA-binding transcriptional regulator [Candidatus Omnitrophica bacterium CG11_big_fil_rev_8_21_14_0_20_42_13]|uniref:Probable transcriptional regulatory protein COV72_00715 n=1 Tax=Candidatus Ghiorseimicrobium undicola TaxID=1974746 RepID=A0A2H0LZJ0_9BACT|nr:MAG: YebC/PmpR family DNA-binding transcriptional regulator [Candidatus Omnitrophica bacterium CG11_big_fil_rev_8_21_14_0_20_42_13]
MSGHSKWSSIKHKKAATDAKRGALFTKLIKEITIAARNGGGSLETNASLRTAVQKAKGANMPSDNIDRAIKKGTGELPGVVYESMIYEGYGAAGVAILVEVVTDNKNRASAEIRNIFSKKGGNLAGAGSVSWMFSKKGYILVDKGRVEEDKLMDIALNAGAEDMKSEGDSFEIITGPAELETVKQKITDNNIEVQSAEVTMIPGSTIKVTGQDAKSVLALVEALEEHDDVQKVHANFDIPDEELEQTA